MNPGLVSTAPVGGLRRLPSFPASASWIRNRSSVTIGLGAVGRCPLRIGAQKVEERTGKSVDAETPAVVETSSTDTVDAAAKKWGLEFGLFKAMTSKEPSSMSNADKAKELLKKYGSAYLITSISFAIVSFAVCYALVSAGVDVAALLAKVGIKASGTSETVGTVAIAYAAHKAASPIRFPPTVALTPVVAQWIGKKETKDQENPSDQDASGRR